MSILTKIAIIHPWLPRYRTAFFEELTKQLRAKQIELHVFYGETPPEWTARNDSATLAGTIQLRTRFFNIGGRTVSYKSTNRIDFDDYRLIIVEQAIRNLELYPLLLKASTRKKLLFWGHGRTYTMKKTNIEERAKSWITNRGSWFFAYTQTGAEAAIKGGFPSARVTAVRNTIDTAALLQDLDSLTDERKKGFRDEFGLTRGHTAIYLGGIDEAKRIPMLLETAKNISKDDSLFKLVIVGDGDLKDHIVEAAADESSIVYLGSLFGPDKALALAASDFMLVPGRVGLVAVDSLVSGRPIVTTRWPYHAPEFEYLQDNETCISTEDALDSYASGALKLINEPDLLLRLTNNCLQEAENYTIPAMSRRFASGVLGALNASPNE